MAGNRKNIPYSEDEKTWLCTVVQTHKHIIENKCTDRTTNQSKNDSWILITEAFNGNAIVTKVSFPIWFLSSYKY